MKFLILTLVIFTISVQYSCCDSNTLKLIHVFFRHGSRTPEAASVYPNDPYKENAFYPSRYGELTLVGKQRAHKLGTLLNKKYKSFLGPVYESDFIETYSTDFDRTKTTALLVLAGLYPPSKKEIWHDGINWQPIPYKYIAQSEDYWFKRVRFYCPNYVKAFKKIMESNEVQKLLKNHKEDFEYISNHTGQDYVTLEDIFGLFQTLYAEQNLNLALPEWTRNIYPDLMYNLSTIQLNLEFYNSALRRLNGGRMLKKVIQHMEQKMENTLEPHKRKIFLYSVHEVNVVQILSSMNLFKPHIPKYNAAVIIEQHLLPEIGYAVKVLYSRDVDEPLKELTLEGCNTICPIEDFIKITKPQVPGNYTEECGASVNLEQYDI